MLFITFDPLLEKTEFKKGDLKAVDWVIIGPSGESKENDEAKVEWERVVRILAFAIMDKCKAFIKPGLRWIPNEYPELPE